MTAHDPRVTLTEAERTWLRLDWPHASDGSIACMCLDCQGPLMRAVERIIAARLDRVRAVAEQWDTGCAREVLAALDAPQDAPRGPVSGEQGAEVAGGRSEGERPGGGHRAPWFEGVSDGGGVRAAYEHLKGRNE